MFRRGLGNGIRLLETTLNLVIFTTLVFVVVQIAGRAAESEKYSVTLSTATEINQSLLQEMRSDLLSSVDLFQNDSTGNAYLRTLDMTGAMAAIDSVLPTINPEGVFGLEPDPGVLTGNTVMFTRYAWGVEKRFVQRQRLDQRGVAFEQLEDRGRFSDIEFHPRGHKDALGTATAGHGTRQRGMHTELTCLVRRCRNDLTGAITTDDHRPTTELRPVALLDGGVERIHVGVQDDSHGGRVSRGRGAPEKQKPRGPASPNRPRSTGRGACV